MNEDAIRGEIQALASFMDSCLYISETDIGIIYGYVKRLEELVK